MQVGGSGRKDSNKIELVYFKVDKNVNEIEVLFDGKKAGYNLSTVSFSPFDK